MVCHVELSELARGLLHNRLEGHVLNKLGVSKTETAELLRFGIVLGVRHNGANRRAEPVADVDVGAVFQAEGLESGTTGAF